MSATPRSVGPGGYRPVPRVANTLLRPAARLQTLDADAIVDAARRATGLSDFGGEDFREPLGVLTEDLRAHPPSPLGRVLIRLTLTKALANRLRVVAAQRARSEAPADGASAPMVIVGWHRSGTTLLHNLLAALPGFRFLPLYRLAEPVSSLTERVKMWLALQGTWTIAPELRDIHQQHVSGPEEDWTLMMGALCVEGFVMHWNVPGYRRWLDGCDFDPAYQFFRSAVEVAATQDEPGRLVLKDPAHLTALRSLIGAFPNARLIWTHRDPATMVASFASLSAIHHRSMYGVYDPHRAGRASLDRCVHALRRGIQSRDAIGEDRLVDIAYRRLRNDPIGVVLDICDRFGIEVTDGGLRAVTERLQELEAGRRSTHVYSLAKWGLDQQTLADAVSFYDRSRYL